MTSFGTVVTAEAFLSGRCSDGTSVDDTLLTAALNLEDRWPSEAERDGRRLRRITRERSGASVRVTPAGGRTFVGVLAGRFALGERECDIVGPGEVLEIPKGGAELVLITPRPTGKLVVLDVGDASAVERGPDRPVPVARGGNADGLPADYYHVYDDRYEVVYGLGAPTWEKERPNEFLVSTIERVGITPCRVIDLGCGEGRDSVFLARAGFDVLGVDVSHAALEKARERAQTEAAICDFLERDVTTLRGIPEGHFDLAINMGCLHMMPDHACRSRHLRRVREVLRPRGRFLLAHCRGEWGHGFWSVLDAHAIGRAVPGHDLINRRLRTPEEPTVPLVLEPYCERASYELVAECKEAGFEVIDAADFDAEAFGNTAVLLLGDLRNACQVSAPTGPRSSSFCSPLRRLPPGWAFAWGSAKSHHCGSRRPDSQLQARCSWARRGYPDPGSARPAPSCARCSRWARSASRRVSV